MGLWCLPLTVASYLMWKASSLAWNGCCRFLWLGSFHRFLCKQSIRDIPYFSMSWMIPEQQAVRETTIPCCAPYLNILSYNKMQMMNLENVKSLSFHRLKFFVIEIISILLRKAICRHLGKLGGWTLFEIKNNLFCPKSCISRNSLD